MTIQIKNRLRSIEPRECGDDATTLIIASIGTSSTSDSTDAEYEKAVLAQRCGADAVTDHSFFGDIDGLHRRMADTLDILVSTVACYELAVALSHSTAQARARIDPIAILRTQAQRGMDMITIHAALTQGHLDLLGRSHRVIPMCSKGGGIIAEYMRTRNCENPYYARFDEVLEVLKEFGVTLSIGTALRPSTVCDSWDELISAELDTMGELTARALSRGVKVIIEGIGHAMLSDIPSHVKLAKARCHSVPYRVLPMATDIGLGADHISGAIATAIAVFSGANAITCVTRAEHVGLPSAGELREGIVAARIAAHCGELSRRRDVSRDRRMSELRWQHGCRGDWRLAVCPDAAREALVAHGILTEGALGCGMCGDYCGLASAQDTYDAGRRLDERTR